MFKKWRTALILFIFPVYVHSKKPALLANKGCEYTNLVNSDGYETGERGKHSIEKTVTLEVLHKGKIVSLTAKMCLFIEKVKCFPDMGPNRKELMALEQHLKKQFPDYDFSLNDKIQHPGFLSGEAKDKLEIVYYGIAVKVRALNCLSGACEERVAGLTLTGTEARCKGPDKDASGGSILVKYADIQMEAQDFANQVKAAKADVDMRKKRCNLGKRDPNSIDLGTALVQMGGPSSALQTIEICLLHPKTRCFPESAEEKKKFLNFIQESIKKRKHTDEHASTTGETEKELTSWSCESGKCDPKTKECAVGKRNSKILQFKEAEKSGTSQQYLHTGVMAIGAVALLYFSNACYLFL